MPAEQCTATSEFGHQCVRMDHSRDRKYPGHIFPMTSEQFETSAMSHLQALASSLGVPLDDDFHSAP